MKTEFPSGKEITRKWHLIDAQDKVLGRVASKTAMMLMGKHKASYTPFLDRIAATWSGTAFMQWQGLENS